jgi:hypothetical protein
MTLGWSIVALATVLSAQANAQTPDRARNISIVGVWKGDVHCEKQGVSKMQWTVTNQAGNGVLEGGGAIPAYGISWAFAGSRVDGNTLTMRNDEHLVIEGNRITGN